SLVAVGRGGSNLNMMNPLRRPEPAALWLLGQGLLRAVSAALVLGAADDDRPRRALNNGHLVEGQGGAVAQQVDAGAAHATLGLMGHGHWLSLRTAWRFSLQRFALCALLFRPCPQMSQIALQARARSVLPMMFSCVAPG